MSHSERGDVAIHHRRRRTAVIRAGGFVVVLAVVLASLLAVVSGVLLRPRPLASAHTPAAAPAPASGAQRSARDAGGTPFRRVLDADRLEALIAAAARRANVPLESLALDVRAGEPSIRFAARIAGSPPVRGRLAARVTAGRLVVRLEEAKVGWLAVPPGARAGVEDLLDRALDLDAALGLRGVRLTAVHLQDDRVVLEGRAGDGARRRVEQRLPSRPRPAVERVGRGIAAHPRFEGSPWYLALGDSLAAGTGLGDLRDSYAARLHRYLRERDGVAYGLANLGIPGERSDGLLRGRQLRAAVEFLRSHPTAYITVDIGANDLLGDLRSSACAQRLDGPACAARVEATTVAFERNLDETLGTLRRAAPDATIVYLGTYNPFGLGLATAFERITDDAVATFNRRAAAVAGRHGVVYADGFRALQGTVRTTTRMLQSPPDVHPRPLGHDLLAAAVADALPPR